MVAVFREVRRVLAPHATAWINLGDSYIAGQGGRQSSAGEMTAKTTPARGTTDLKPKDLAGIPWMVAFALRADGWYLRSDIIWSKPNPMPESVTDRPTKAHEYVFLLSKGPRYWFDAEAVREPYVYANGDPRQSDPNYDPKRIRNRGGRTDGYTSGSGTLPGNPAGRNVRSVWEIATQPYAGAHFATYPEELVRRCVLAGCPEWVCQVCGVPRTRIVEREPNNDGYLNGPGGRHKVDASRNDARSVGSSTLATVARYTSATLGWSDCGHNNYRPGIVLDPFLGSGTTALVARKHGRHSIGIELNEEYARLAAERTRQLSLLGDIPEPTPVLARGPRGLTGGAYSPPGQTPHSNARPPKP